MANPLAYHIDKTPHAVKINEKKKPNRWTGGVGTKGRLKSYLKIKRMRNVLAT